MKNVGPAIVLALALTFVTGAQESAKKVTKAEALNAVVSRVDPEYPEMAKQLRVAGTIELEAVVSETGSVVKVNIVSGNPMLTAAGQSALKRWKFKPFVEDGKPVQVLAPVAFAFKL